MGSTERCMLEHPRLSVCAAEGGSGSSMSVLGSASALLSPRFWYWRDSKAVPRMMCAWHASALKSSERRRSMQAMSTFGGFVSSAAMSRSGATSTSDGGAAGCGGCGACSTAPCSMPGIAPSGTSPACPPAAIALVRPCARATPALGLP